MTPHIGVHPKKPPAKADESLRLRPRAARSTFGEKATVVGRIPGWSRWPKELLIARRAEMGARDFDRGYRQFAISDEDLTFRAEWVDQCLDRSFVLPSIVQPDGPFEKMRRFGGVDLAIASAEMEGAYFVSLIIAVDSNHHRWLIGFERTRGISMGQQLALVGDQHARYRCEVWGVETNAYQKAFQIEAERSGIIPTRAVYTNAVHKRDLEVGLPSMGTEFEQSRWHFPVGNKESRRIIDPLLEELYAHPAGTYTDSTMALFFARQMHLVGPRVIPRLVVLHRGS